MIEHWNGKTWKILKSPNPADRPNTELVSVACPTTTNCIAVGTASSGDYSVRKTLVERWNGKSWTIVTSPNPTDLPKASLSGVACSTSTSCIAVGGKSSTDDFSANKTLVERWNGKSWTIVASPNPTDLPSASLVSVACPTPTNCTAVGYKNSSDFSANKTLVVRWNGKTWAIVASPNPTDLPKASLYGVACPTPTNCTAVGEKGDGSTTAETLVERWNGKSWAIVTSPNPTDLPKAGLSGVACSTSTSCIAVGAKQSSDDSTTKTLVERWNGKSWAIVTSPNPTDLPRANLLSVACPTSTNCTAVGFRSSSDYVVGKTLVERYA